MRRKIVGLLIAVLMALGAPLPSYAAGDDIALAGVPLEEGEMNEVRGGFQTPDGSFFYFSMDLMRVRFLSSSDAGNPASGTNSPGWLNALNQSAVITKDGISFNMQVVQANGPSDNGTAGSTLIAPQAGNLAGNTAGVSSVVMNPGMVTANFLGNQGIVNANINTGTGNVTQSIANILNINIGIFNVGNTSQVLPALRGWLQF